MRFSPVLSLLTVPFLIETAWSGEVVLELGGVNFDGGPAFSVTLGSAEVGSGVIDPEGDERQWFGFEVADQMLRAGGDLTISFTNDVNLGPDQDRSLLVFGARAGSYTLAPNEFLLVNALSGEQMVRERSPALPLWTNDEVAVAISPPNGWIAAEGATPTGSTDCPPVLMIGGFAINGVELAPQQIEVLSNQASGSISANCIAKVVGYASMGGSDEVNQIISLARAQAVGDALLDLGLPKVRLEVASGGATSRFGQSAKDNRVVEVRFEPVSGGATDEDNTAPATKTIVLTLGHDDQVTVSVDGGLSRPEQLWMLEAAKTRLLQAAPQ